MTEIKTRNLGGRPKGAVDPLSATGRRRLIASLYEAAQGGDHLAARQLIEMSASAEKERNNGRS